MNIGTLELELIANVARLQKDMAAAVSTVTSASQKMASELGAIAKGIEGALAPLQTLTVKFGSLESQIGKAQASVISLAKGLLLGSAAGMSIDSIKSKVMGAIDSMAGLKTISEKTGSSVENISKLAFAAKQTSSDIDAVAGALGKLSKGMAGADNETKGAGAALKVLGLSAKDAAGHLKDPSVMFTEIAHKLADYKDGASKVALVQALLGKSGADMLPTLKAIGEQGEIAAKVTDAQATAARQYQRDLAKLDAQKGALFKTIAVALLPTMSDFVNVLVDSSKNVNLTNKAVKKLADDQSLGDWADTVAMGLALIIDTIKLLPALFSVATAGFKDVAAMAKIAFLSLPGTMLMTKAAGGSPIDNLKEAYKEQEAAAMAYGEAIAGVLDMEVDTTRKAMQAKIDARKAAGTKIAKDAAEAAKKLADANKKDLKFNTSGEDGAAAAETAAAIKKEEGAYTSLIAAIKSKTAADQMELKTGLAATENQKFAIKLDIENERSTKNLTGAGLAKLAALKAQATAELAKNKIAEEGLLKQQAEKDVSKYIEQGTVARAASAAALKVEYEMYGKSGDARDIAMVAVKNQTALEQFLSQEKLAGKIISEGQITKLKEETAARTLVEQATLAQTKALGTAASLAEENKKFGIEYIGDAKERAAEELRIKSATIRALIAQTGEGTDAQKKLQTEYDTWYANQVAKPQLDANKKMWESVDQTAHDAFVNVFESGKNAFDKLRDTLKSGLLDLLYQMTIKKWIFNIGAQVTGNASISNVAQGASGLLGSASSASSLYSGVKTAAGWLGIGGATLGSGVALGAGALGTGAAAGAGALGSGVAFGSGLLGSGAAATGALGSGVALGSGALGAGAAAGTGLIGGASAALAAIPVWGWAALAAAAVVSFMDKGPEKNTRLNFTSNNAAGAISINERGNEGKTNAYIGDTGTSSFGTFGVSSTFWMEAAQPAVQSFIKTVSQTDDALAAFLTSAEKASVTNYLTGKTSIANTGAEGTNPNANGELDGVFAERINNILAGVEPGLDALIAGFDGTSQELSTEAAALLQYRVALRDSGEAVFGQIVTLQDIAALKAPTELTSAALNRITSDFTATNQVAAILGKTSTEAFGSAGLASLAAREQLVLLSGGVSTLGAQATAFATNYLTEAERLAPVTKALDAAMASLGLSGVTTREQFKQTVVGLDLTTAAGAAQYASMMSLADAFAQVHPAIEATAVAAKSAADILSEHTELQKRFDAATMTSTELRDKEREALDASNQSLFDSVIVAEAAKVAADALAATNKGYADDIFALEKAARPLAEQRALDVAGMNATTLALYERKEALTAEAKATERAKVVAETKTSLELKLYNMTHTAAEQLANTRRLEIDATDDSLKGLVKQIHAQEDLANATAATTAALTTQASLHTKYSTDQQKVDDAINTLNKGFAALHLDVPQTAAAFRTLIDSVKVDTPNGQAIIDELNKLSPAFDIVQADIAARALKLQTGIDDGIAEATAAANKLVSTNQGYQDQIDTLLKAGMTAAQVRAMEIRGMAGSTVALYDRLHALQAAADAEAKAKAAADAAAQERKTLQDQVDQLTMTSTELREKERLAIVAANLPLFDRITALNAAKAAAEAATEAAKAAADAAKEAADKVLAIAQQQRGLDIQLMEATGDAIGALAAKRKDETAALASSLQATQQAIYAAQDAQAKVDSTFAALGRAVDAEKKRLDEALTGQIKSITDAAEIEKTAQEAKSAAIKSIFDDITAALKSTQIESSALNAQRRAEAQATLRDALAMSNTGGSLANFTGLSDAVATVSKPDAGMFATFADYARDQAQTAALLASLHGNAGAQSSVAQLTLDAIMKASEDQIAALQSQHDDAIKALDVTLATAQAQLNALRGIDDSVLSVADGLAAFQTAVTGVLTLRQPVVGGGRSQAESDAMPGNIAATAHWAALQNLNLVAYAATVRPGDMSTVQAIQAQIDQNNAWIGAAAGLDGSHANGLDYVPFDGYRAELHVGERVQTAAAARDADETAAEVRELRTVVARQAAALDQIARSTKKLSDQFERLTESGESLEVKVKETA